MPFRNRRPRRGHYHGGNDLSGAGASVLPWTRRTFSSQPIHWSWCPPLPSRSPGCSMASFCCGCDEAPPRPATWRQRAPSRPDQIRRGGRPTVPPSPDLSISGPLEPSEFARVHTDHCPLMEWSGRAPAPPSDRSWSGTPKTRSTPCLEQLNSAIAVAGFDIGKNSFHVVGLDRRGAIVLRHKWSRGQVDARFANMRGIFLLQEDMTSLSARGQLPSHLSVTERGDAGVGNFGQSFVIRSAPTDCYEPGGQSPPSRYLP